VTVVRSVLVGGSVVLLTVDVGFRTLNPASLTSKTSN
jgi:hypothetical protein